MDIITNSPGEDIEEFWPKIYESLVRRVACNDRRTWQTLAQLNVAVTAVTSKMIVEQFCQ